MGRVLTGKTKYNVNDSNCPDEIKNWISPEEANGTVTQAIEIYEQGESK